MRYLALAFMLLSALLFLPEVHLSEKNAATIIPVTVMHDTVVIPAAPAAGAMPDAPGIRFAAYRAPVAKQPRAIAAAPSPDAVPVALDATTPTEIAPAVAVVAAVEEPIIPAAEAPPAEAAAEEIVAEDVTPTDPEPTAPVEPVLAAAEDAPAEPIATEIWSVNVAFVNMREGPSTRFSVVEVLAQDMQAELIEEGQRGWVHIRVADTGAEGWIHSRYLNGPDA